MRIDDIAYRFGSGLESLDEKLVDSNYHHQHQQHLPQWVLWEHFVVHR
jgi:hypothetical protein